MIDFAKLKGAMAENDLSQADLARILGLSTSTINLKLNKKAKFTLDEAKTLADYFEQPIETLFFNSALTDN